MIMGCWALYNFRTEGVGDEVMIKRRLEDWPDGIWGTRQEARKQ